MDSESVDVLSEYSKIDVLSESSKMSVVFTKLITVLPVLISKKQMNVNLSPHLKEFHVS